MFKWHVQDILWPHLIMKECEHLCLSMHFTACFGEKKWCQDKVCHDDNDCRCSLTAKGGCSWKSVGWFIERGEGWDRVQGMLQQKEESYKEEAVWLQKSDVSTRYFPFPTLLEATVQDWFRVNSGCAQGGGTRRIQRKMPQALWRQLTVAVTGTSQNRRYNKGTKSADQILMMCFLPSRSHFKELLWCTDFTKQKRYSYFILLCQGIRFWVIERKLNGK